MFCISYYFFVSLFPKAKDVFKNIKFRDNSNRNNRHKTRFSQYQLGAISSFFNCSRASSDVLVYLIIAMVPIS